MTRIVRTETKVCKKCGEEKLVSQFYTKGTDCWNANCKPCHNELRGVYREQNRESINEGKRAFYHKHREKHLAYFASSERKMRWFAWKLDHHFNMTVEQYVELVEKQDGRCAICKQLPTEVNGHKHKHRLHVDHDHETGEVRGLLCSLCNCGLGSFKDNPERLLEAINYLNHSQSATKLLNDSSQT